MLTIAYGLVTYHKEPFNHIQACLVVSNMTNKIIMASKLNQSINRPHTGELLCMWSPSYFRKFIDATDKVYKNLLLKEI